MLRFGPDAGPVVVVALPLFEEANRTRAFAVTICRLLAKRDLASVLPDLPGQGESGVLTHNACLSAMRSGFAAAVKHLHGGGRRTYSADIRSGAIADTNAHSLGRWYLSPVSGRQLLEEFATLLSAAKREADVRLLRNAFQIDDATSPMEIAGNLVCMELLQDLTVDTASYPLGSLGVPLRTVRLHTDPKPADRHVPGPPLWRRAEPDNDPALATLLADDIADWIAHCEG